MKSSWKGSFSQRLQDRLHECALGALAIARSPQPYIDRGWAASLKFLFSVIFISLVLSKCFHIFAYVKALAVPSLLVWGSTFFLADFLLILVAYGLARSFEWRMCQNLAALVTALFSLVVSSMISANISFFFHVGVEIYWRKVRRFHKGSPSAWFVLSALAIAFIVDALIIVGAYFAAPYLFKATGDFLGIWGSFLSPLFRRCRREKSLPHPEIYEQIAINDFEDGHSDSESVTLLDTPRILSEQKSHSKLKRVLVILGSLTLVLLRCIRPSDLSYYFLSESLPLAPFSGPKYRPAHATIASLPGDYSWLKGLTALDTFPTFDWLPPVNSSGALPDWSPFRLNLTNISGDEEDLYKHYNPMKDPLHIPNLQNDILEPIREVLKDRSVKIKHIVLIKLESTRQDVWPFNSNSYIMKHIKDSFPEGQIPENIERRLSNLTRTAERLTGFETEFGNDEDRPKSYGGISARKAYTSGTYTLKSITGTVCGVSPMAVEANLEWEHDIYQPCLPHIFEALNNQPGMTSDTDDWTSWPWYTMWMQSHPDTWDKQRLLTPHLGYQEVMTRFTINDAGGKYILEENEEEEHHGHEDKVLKNYMRDLVADAKKNNTRLFLSHLTHNTHTPYFKPGDYETLIGNSGSGLNEKLNRYLNTMAYQDEWIADILQVLEEAGVANETLLIMAGDHGLSLPNDGGITAYHDPHAGNFHVPLFFSHPKLPQIEVDSAVLSTQILPTLLDLLIETDSLNEPSMKIIKALLPLYEGQSMLRELIPERDGKQEWHFSTMNPGGTWVSMRAAAKPYRLVVPLIPDAPWRFTDVVADPLEFHPEENLDVLTLIDEVRAGYGLEAGNWLTEAAHVGQWFITENRRRWKYDPESSNGS